MGTKAKGPLAERLLGSVSETVLAFIDRPVLLVGPRAPTGTGLRPTLIACAESDDIDTAAPVIASWVRTFDGGPPSITHVSPTPAKRIDDDVETGALEHVRQLSDRLRVLGVIDWSAKVVHGTDVATSLEEVADRRRRRGPRGRRARARTDAHCPPPQRHRAGSLNGPGTPCSSYQRRG